MIAECEGHGGGELHSAGPDVHRATRPRQGWAPEGGRHAPQMDQSLEVDPHVRAALRAFHAGGSRHGEYTGLLGAQPISPKPAAECRFDDEAFAVSVEGQVQRLCGLELEKPLVERPEREPDFLRQNVRDERRESDGGTVDPGLDEDGVVNGESVVSPAINSYWSVDGTPSERDQGTPGQPDRDRRLRRTIRPHVRRHPPRLAPGPCAMRARSGYRTPDTSLDGGHV